MRGSEPGFAPDVQTRQQLSTLRCLLQYLKSYNKQVPIALSLVGSIQVLQVDLEEVKSNCCTQAEFADL